MAISTQKLHLPPPNSPALPALWVSLFSKKGEQPVPIPLPEESRALSGRKPEYSLSWFCWNIQLVHVIIPFQICTKHTISLFSFLGKKCLRMPGVCSAYSSVIEYLSSMQETLGSVFGAVRKKSQTELALQTTTATTMTTTERKEKKNRLERWPSG